MGMSMGGYLAARAAAFDHRISACILNRVREALVEAMRFDTEEGNFCEALLEKIKAMIKL
jgi:hypothetical protein